MQRFHVHIRIDDSGANIDVYSQLFSKHRKLSKMITLNGY